MTKNTWVWVIVLVVIIIIGGLWFSYKDTPVDVIQPATTTTPTATTTSSEIIKSFVITGQNFSFNPSEIRVNVGDKVRITFKSQDMLHDWVIDEFNARTNKLSTGQEETTEFIATRAGTFEYYCSVGNHRQMGMVGKLIVE